MVPEIQLKKWAEQQDDIIVHSRQSHISFCGLDSRETFQIRASKINLMLRGNHLLLRTDDALQS